MMRTILTLGILTVSGLALSANAHAQNSGLNYVPPGGAPQVMEGEDNDALNYFAKGKQKEAEMAAQQEMAVQQEIINGGKVVPASQLDALPETVSIEGKTELKIQGGNIVTGGTEANYAPCDATSSNDECVQKHGADPVITKTDVTYEEPTTLDQQLIEKQGDAAPAPTMPETGDSIVNNEKVEDAIENNVVNTGVNVENTAVVDKARGAKTNIISNTDTGVELGQ